MKQTLPSARKKSLIVKELADETLVYDLQTNQACCMNSTAALVWKNCDGERTVGQMRELLKIESDSPVSIDIIWLALDQLEKFNLLETGPHKPAVPPRMTRRQLARSIGVAAIVLPLVTTITAPTAQAQASDCKNKPCNVNADCCPSSPVCNQSNNKCK